MTEPDDAEGKIYDVDLTDPVFSPLNVAKASLADRNVYCICLATGNDVEQAIHWIQEVRALEDRTANPLGPALYIIGPPEERLKPWQSSEIIQAGGYYYDYRDLIAGGRRKGEESADPLKCLAAYLREPLHEAGPPYTSPSPHITIIGRNSGQERSR